MGRVLHFGKYDGMDMLEVAQTDPEYVLWAVDNIEGSGISADTVARAMRALETGDDYEYDPLSELVGIVPMVDRYHEEDVY